MRLNKRERKVVLTAIFFAGSIIYYFWFLSPILGEYMTLQQHISLQERKLTNLEQTEQAKEALKEKIEEYKNELNDLEKILPSHKRLPEIVVHLERFASDSDVKLQGIVFSEGNNEKKDKAKENSNYMEIPLEIAVRGNYENELNFLRLLEDYPRFCKINKLTVAQAFQGVDKQIDLKINLSAFAAIDNEGLAREPEAYDFMTGEFGKSNPFVPLTTKVSSNKNPSLSPGDKNTEDPALNELMSKFIKVVLED